jgi:hypothetical protein
MNQQQNLSDKAHTAVEAQVHALGLRRPTPRRKASAGRSNGKPGRRKVTR